MPRRLQVDEESYLELRKLCRNLMEEDKKFAEIWLARDTDDGNNSRRLASAAVAHLLKDEGASIFWTREAGTSHALKWPEDSTLFVPPPAPSHTLLLSELLITMCLIGSSYTLPWYSSSTIATAGSPLSNTSDRVMSRAAREIRRRYQMLPVPRARLRPGIHHR